ncbi:hypothetical protein MHTCC0001_15120 [Flavobacteriaceae bacterium MHTCC 0001]
MAFTFEILNNTDLHKVVPLVEKLNDFKISKAVLLQRFKEMSVQNYECAIILLDDTIIGVCGLWFCTRHYAGKSVEVDHVFIDETYRGKGLGKTFLDWIYTYAKENKGCETVELNTYVTNFPSHKFYCNEGFKILGYHFFKKLE